LKNAINSNVKQLILIGRDAPEIAAALDGSLPILMAKNMQEAVAKAGELATQDSIVLLSPACASFDMYQNFEKRGDDFVACVKRYISGGCQ